MPQQSQLWLIRHAPVGGPRGMIPYIDAPPDVSDAAALLRVREQLPDSHVAISSPARRARETAAALGLVVSPDPAFSEQDFGDWTGQTHEDIRQTLKQPMMSSGAPLPTTGRRAAKASRNRSPG